MPNKEVYLMRNSILLMLVCLPLYSQTQHGGITIMATLDASGAITLTSPFRLSGTDPVTCDSTKREAYWNTTDNELRVCTSSNVFTSASLKNFAVSGNTLQIKNNSGTVVASFDLTTGFLTEGIGITTGHAKTLGNPGDTGASSLTIEHGDTTAKPGYMKVKSHGGIEANLHACGTSDGHACVDPASPSAVSQDFVTTLLNTSCVDTGSSDSYACNLSPAITTYQTGGTYSFQANTVNTGAATLALNGLAAVTVKKLAGGITTDLEDNDIRADQWVTVKYDGTNFQMQSQTGNASAASFDITDPREVRFRDEFGTGGTTNNAIGNLGWALISVGAAPTVAKSASTFENAGNHSFTTTATSGQGGGICLGSTAGLRTLGNLATNSDKSWRVVWVFALGETTTTRFRIGVGSCNTTAQLDDFVGLRFDTSAGFTDTNFQFFVRVSSGSEAVSDSGVAADTNRHTLVVYSDGVNANRIYAKLDNGTPVSFCASGCTVATAPPSVNYDPVAIVVTDTTATRSFSADLFAYKATVSTAVDDRNP